MFIFGDLIFPICTIKIFTYNCCNVYMMDNLMYGNSQNVVKPDKNCCISKQIFPNLFYKQLDNSSPV